MPSSCIWILYQVIAKAIKTCNQWNKYHKEKILKLNSGFEELNIFHIFLWNKIQCISLGSRGSWRYPFLARQKCYTRGFRQYQDHIWRWAVFITNYLFVLSITTMRHYIIIELNWIFMCRELPWWWKFSREENFANFTVFGQNYKIKSSFDPKNDALWKFIPAKFSKFENREN